MGSFTYTVPVPGTDLNSIADPQVATALTTLLTWGNGQIDAANIAGLFSQSAGVNTGSQTVKGAVNIAASQSTGSTTYTTLATPDQITGLVVPANGLVLVRYQATWQESVIGAGRAAIFIGSNQLVVQNPTGSPSTPVSQAAEINQSAAPVYPLSSCPFGLVTGPVGAGTYTGPANTGQALAVVSAVGTGAQTINWNINGVNYFAPASGSSGSMGLGGPCEIFGLPAGTYTVSVRFSASSGTVTVQNRTLWVEVRSYS